MGLLINDHEAVETLFGGIGVAICDLDDYCVFEVRKHVTISRDMEGDVVELLALIEGLNSAVELGIKRVQILCDNHLVYQYLMGLARPTNNTIMNLVNDFLLIGEKFSFCFPFLVNQNSFNFAYNLAREAAASQTTKYAESASHKKMALLEQCTIFFESIHSGQMVYIKKCLHTYCISCMRKHVEAKLLQGQLPNCPHENCKSKLQTKSCSKFLDPKLYDLMNLRIKEASIPSTEKVYCPLPNCSALMSKTEVKKHTATSSYKRSGMRKCVKYPKLYDLMNLRIKEASIPSTEKVYCPLPNCSALMSKTEVKKHTATSSYKRSGMRKCVKCQRCFCINCKVAWHEDITCNGYMKHYQSGNEAKFECLASWQRWRQCIKCKHMVELAEGCYHVTCREKALRLIEVAVVNVILESPCNDQPKFSRSGSYLGSFSSLQNRDHKLGSGFGYGADGVPNLSLEGVAYPPSVSLKDRKVVPDSDQPSTKDFALWMNSLIKGLGVICSTKGTTDQIALMARVILFQSEAWKFHCWSIVDYCVTPFGTLATTNPADKLSLNYDRVFLREFTSESSIVEYFSRKRELETFKIGADSFVYAITPNNSTQIRTTPVKHKDTVEGVCQESKAIKD
nr:ribonuclease H domain-containing protein [Tanacetum cinerariifolium]